MPIWPSRLTRNCQGFSNNHITAFMLDAGKYIINTFYGGDARLALAKNKSKDKPPSLKLLIEKYAD